LEAAERVEGRINGLGVLRQSYKQWDRIKSGSVARVSDPQQAERVLGGTAQLEFRQQSQVLKHNSLLNNRCDRNYWQSMELRKLVTRQRLKKSGSLEAE